MAYAFYDMGLHRLWSQILTFNGASVGAYVKNCGWKIEGTLREHVFRGGGYCDAFAIGILKSEFDSASDAQLRAALGADRHEDRSGDRFNMVERFRAAIGAVPIPARADLVSVKPFSVR